MDNHNIPSTKNFILLIKFLRIKVVIFYAEFFIFIFFYFHYKTIGYGHVLQNNENYMATKEIFGVWPRLIKVFPDKTIQYYVYPSSISADTRADYYTDAEILFGEHPIYDLLSLISFLLDVVPSVSLSLFSMFYPPAGVVLGSIELVKFLFFSASASRVLSSGASSVMEEYTSNIYTLSSGESAGVKAGKAMG